MAKPVIHSSGDGDLGCFHFAAMNNAAVNTDLHVSVWACFISLWWDFILRVSWLISPFLAFPQTVLSGFTVSFPPE